MKSVYSRISDFTLRYSHIILILTAVLTMVAGTITSHLGSKGDFIDLLPPNSTSVKDLNVIRDHVGGEGYLMVVLEGGNIEKSKQFIEALVPELRKIPEVNYVDYKFDKKFFEDRNLLYIEKEDLKILAQRLKDKIDYERNKMNPFYIDLLEEKKEFNIDDIKNKYSTAEIKDYYITKNPTRLVVLIKPNGFAGSLEFCKTLLSKTKMTIAQLNPKSFDPDLKIRHTGRYVTRIEETEFMFKDLKRTTLVSLIGIFLLLALYTRQITASIFIGIPLIISILYSLAITTLTLGYLNIVTAVLVGILSGMGIDFGIHLYLRYLEERRKHHSFEKAIHVIHSSTGKPLILAGLTTAVAFLVLIPMEFTGISQLGWICGGGILICMLNTYLLLPALLVMREKFIPLKHKLMIVPTLEDFLLTPKKYPKPYATLLIAGMIGLVSLGELRHIKFDYNFRKLVADKNGTLALQDQISDAFGVSLSPAIVYVPQLEDIPKISEIVNKLKKENPKSTISSVLSLYSYVPKYQEEKIPDIRKLGEIASDPLLRFLEGEEAQKLKDLKRWAEVKPFSMKDLPTHLQQQFNPIHGHTGSFLFIFPFATRKKFGSFKTELKILVFGSQAKP
ncbi:MAG: MMPL family transporter [Deltaproteobacteria bacterium]|nr:MMPL family transporter [Deltaproteobacteria bacterium]